MNSKIKAYIFTYIVMFLYSYVFFNNLIVSIVISGIISIKFYEIAYEYLLMNEYKNKRIIFREFLDIFNTNIISGLNFYESLKNTYLELCKLFSKEEKFNLLLADSLKLIDNGSQIDHALENIKNNMKLEEVNIFFETINIALNTGMNLSEITNASKDSLTENIALELELATITNNSKKEFIIMAVLPLVILTMVSISSDATRLDYLIRVPMFGLLMFALFLGNKIVNKEI